MATTVADLGKRVKAKYPGSYDDLADDQLGERVKAKYPGAYEDFESPAKGTGSFDLRDPFAANKSARPSTAAPRSPVPPATNWLNKPALPTPPKVDLGSYEPPLEAKHDFRLSDDGNSMAVTEKARPRPHPLSQAVPGMERLGGVTPGPPSPPLPAPTWETEDTDEGYRKLSRFGENQAAKGTQQGSPMDIVGPTVYGGAQAIWREGIDRLARPVGQALNDEGRQQMLAAGAPPEQVGPPQVTRETFPEMLAGATGIAGGLMEATKPMMAGQLLAAPAKFGLTLATGMGTDALAKRGLEAAGVDPRVAGAVGMGAGLAAGGVAHGAVSPEEWGAANSQAIHEKYGQEGNPIAVAKAQSKLAGPPPVEVNAAPPPRAYPGVPATRPMPGPPIPGPGLVKPAIESAQVFQDDAMQRERMSGVPGPEPVKSAEESAAAFTTPPKVKVAGQFDLRRGIERATAPPETAPAPDPPTDTPPEPARFEDNEAARVRRRADLDAADKLAREQQNEQKAARAAAKQSWLDKMAGEADARLKAKGIYGGRASANEFLDPSTMRDMALTIARDLKDGAVAVADVIAKFGEAVRPHAEEILRQAREMAGGVERYTPPINGEVIRPADQVSREITNIRPLEGETPTQMMARGRGLLNEYGAALRSDRRLATVDIRKRLNESAERVQQARRDFDEHLLGSAQRIEDAFQRANTERAEWQKGLERKRAQEKQIWDEFLKIRAADRPRWSEFLNERIDRGEPAQNGVKRFLKEEDGYQRVPTKQDLIELKDAALDKWDTFQRQFRQHTSDRYAAISDLMKQATAPIPAKDSAYVAARNYSGIGGKAEVRLDKLGKILRSAQRDNLIEPMTNYALYERYEELSDRGDPDFRFPEGKTIHQIRTDKANLEQAIGPQNVAKVQRYVQQIRDYSNDLLAEAHRGGLISQEQYDAILAKNQKYMPLHRLAYLMDQIESGGGGNSNAFSVPGQDLYHSIKGSDKQIVDPITSIIGNTYKTVATIERNSVAQKIGDLAGRAEFKGIVDEMKPGQHKLPGKEVISALRDGKRVDYQVPKDVGRALKNMNSRQVDIVTKAASKMGSMLRSGATSLNVAFLASNIVRDYQTATAVSKVGFTPIDWANGFWQAVAAKTGLFDDAVYKAYQESTGSMGGYFGGSKDLARSREDLTDGFMKKEILPSWKNNRLGAAGKATVGAGIGMAVAGPPGALVGAGTGLVLHTVRHLGELTELAPRLGVFMKALEQGKPLVEAGFDSRNATVDFSKSGDTMRMLNMWVPFLNARLQGNINLFQAMRPSQVGPRRMFGATRSAGKVAVWNMFKAGSMVGIPAIAQYLYNHRDEETTKVWNNISDYEKRGNFIAIFGNHQDKDGYYTQAIKIPKGDVKAFANPIESALDYVYRTDPKSLDRLAVEFLSDISPVDFEKGGKADPSQLLNEIPPTLKGMIEGYENKNMFTGSQLVPDFYEGQEMRKASPEKQYTKRTSNFGKAVGQKLGVAPIKVDNFMGTQFGGVGHQLTAMSGSGDTPAGFAPGLKQVQRRYVGARGSQNEKEQAALALISTEHADAGLDKARAADSIADKIDAMKPEERGAYVQQMIASGEMDEATFKAVKSSIEGRRMGLLPIERSLKSRPLAERAEYIANELRAASPARKKEIIARYIEKNIMTEQVFRQVAQRLSAPVAQPHQ